MNKQQKQYVMLGALVVLAIGVVLWQTMGGSGVETPPTGPSPSPSTKVAKNTATMPPPTPSEQFNLDELILDIEKVNFDYQQERIERNPMQPLVGAMMTGAGSGVMPGEGGLGGLPGGSFLLQKYRQVKVTGIIYDKFNPLAVVNDEVVGRGHTYADGAEVYDIEPDKVIFKVQDSLLPREMEEL